MFAKGDVVMYPAHGTGVIEDIETRSQPNGQSADYFVIRLYCGNMRMFVPCDRAKEQNLRPVLDKDTVISLLSHLSEIEVPESDNWSKRYRENADRLRTGKAEDTAQVYKYLYERNLSKGLSAGERKMYQSVRQIIVSELMASLSISKEQAEEKLLEAM